MQEKAAEPLTGVFELYILKCIIFYTDVMQNTDRRASNAVLVSNEANCFQSKFMNI